MSITIKKSVSGSIKSRWPKPRVVKWLEIGAVPALLGLWLPDWVGGYHDLFNGIGKWYSLPPLLTYIGAVILLVACAQGVKDMGYHYRGVLISGVSAVAFAGISVVTHLLISRAPLVLLAATIGSSTLALFFGTVFFWFTIEKVAEITTEARTYWTGKIVAVLGITALVAGILAVVLLLTGSTFWYIAIRASVSLTTLAFAACRYGVYCYKTQKSIGATFAVPPAEQFWV